MKLEVFWKMTWKAEAVFSGFVKVGMMYFCVCLIMSQTSKTKITKDMKTADLMFASFK